MERTPVPANIVPVRMVTPKQVDYLNSLRARKDTSALSPEQRAWLEDAEFDKLTFDQAGRVIPVLKDLSWASPDGDSEAGRDLPEVKDGRYAIPKDDGTLMFYSVKKGRFITFVNVWASDARYPIKALPEKRRILEAILADPDSGPRFGREIGACYVCGRTLTDETSRSLGIGPVCRGES